MQAIVRLMLNCTDDCSVSLGFLNWTAKGDDDDTFACAKI